MRLCGWVQIFASIFIIVSGLYVFLKGYTWGALPPSWGKIHMLQIVVGGALLLVVGVHFSRWKS